MLSNSKKDLRDNYTSTLRFLSYFCLRKKSRKDKEVPEEWGKPLVGCPLEHHEKPLVLRKSFAAGKTTCSDLAALVSAMQGHRSHVHKKMGMMCRAHLLF